MYVYIFIYIYVYIYEYIYACVYVYIYIFMYIYLYIYMYIYVCVYICMYMYVYICIYICIYIYTVCRLCKIYYVVTSVAWPTSILDKYVRRFLITVPIMLLCILLPWRLVNTEALCGFFSRRWAARRNRARRPKVGSCSPVPKLHSASSPDGNSCMQMGRRRPPSFGEQRRTSAHQRRTWTEVSQWCCCLLSYSLLCRSAPSLTTKNTLKTNIMDAFNQTSSCS